MFSSTLPVLPLTQSDQASISLTLQGCSCQSQQWFPCCQSPQSHLWIHLTQPPSNTGHKLSKSSSLNTYLSPLLWSHSVLGFLPPQPPLLDSLFLPDCSIFESPSTQFSDILSSFSSPLFFISVYLLGHHVQPPRLYILSIYWWLTH